MREQMDGIARQLIDERRGAIASGSERSRDVLSLVLKANMDPHISEKQRLADVDVIARA